MPQTIALGADHAGYALKNHLKAWLENQGCVCIDVGTDSTERCDAIDFAVPACKAVLANQADMALLVCGTGAAMSMAANELDGIRACCCSDSFTAELTRRHNNANVLCLGARVLGEGLAEKLVELFLHTPFEGGVYQARNDKLTALEQSRNA